MLAHVDKFEDEEDQASLNNEGRFMPKGEWRGSDFQRDPRWQVLGLIPLNPIV